MCCVHRANNEKYDGIKINITNKMTFKKNAIQNSTVYLKYDFNKE